MIAVRRLRLGAAYVLLLYLTLHFVNHALGLVSLNAMETGRWWFLALWRSAPSTVALYSAVAVHGILALWLLYERRTLRMPAWEAAQYALGLALPPLLVAHVVGTRIAWWRFGAEDPYSRVVFSLWLQVPESGARQTVVVVLAWLHACIGVHYWLRFRPWYRRAAPWLFAVALLLPTLALLGSSPPVARSPPARRRPAGARRCCARPTLPIRPSPRGWWRSDRAFWMPI